MDEVDVGGWSECGWMEWMWVDGVDVMCDGVDVT